MLEVAGSSKEHCDSGGFSCGDDFTVANGTARLHDRGDSGGNSRFNPIRKGQEGVASKDAASGLIASTLDGDMDALNTVWLAAPDTGDRRLFRQHNGV